MQKKAPIYIVAGDEMQKIMRNKFPERETVPFREDLSRGKYDGFDLDASFIRSRASFWRISESEYVEKLYPMISLDLSRDYVLCFGEDDCCQENLKFVIGYLKNRGYDLPIHVRIVDEYDLKIKKEYCVD